MKIKNLNILVSVFLVLLLSLCYRFLSNQKQKREEVIYDNAYRQAIEDIYFMRPTKFRILESPDGKSYIIFKMEEQKNKEINVPTVLNK